MIELVVYTVYALLRCGVLIAIVQNLFPGIFGIFSGLFVMLGGIIEYFLFLTTIHKVSKLEKKENSQENHTL